jgi:hypothetical protein
MLGPGARLDQREHRLRLGGRDCGRTKASTSPAVAAVVIVRLVGMDSKWPQRCCRGQVRITLPSGTEGENYHSGKTV